ncbi:MAG: RNA polymerase sigma-70 factor [Niabella sp.]
MSNSERKIIFGAAATATSLQDCRDRVALGDTKAFRFLFDHFAEKLTRFAYAIIKDEDEAILIMDEVFVKVWKNRQSIATVENITSYLYKATKNTALNHLSKKAKDNIAQPFDFIDIYVEANDNPEQNMIFSETYHKIQTAVEELPPKCKMVFKLVREDGLRYKEVADILNISVKTVDAQMVLAVKKISEKLQNHFEAFPRKKVKKN